MRVLNGGLFMDPKSNIKSPCDLKGKTIAVTNKPDSQAIVDTMLAECKMTRKDVKWVDAGFASNKLVDTGKAAAAWGVQVYEGALYRSQHGKNPDWLLGTEHGVPPFYWMLIVGNPDWMKKNPNSTRLFLEATQKGIESYRDNPDAITDHMVSLNEVVDKKAAHAMAADAKRMWSDAETDTNGLLWQDGQQFVAARDWMKKQGLFKGADAPIEKLMTNEYLPKK
jgi:putative hydroxymethylpyrimidine transport system substrate-binding protein